MSIMKEIGLMIRPMEMAPIFIQTAPSTLEAGKMINSTGMEWRSGLMGPLMRECTLRGKSRERLDLNW